MHITLPCAARLSSARVVAGCGGSPMDPGEVDSVGPPLTPVSAMTAQEKSDWIDAVFFASGPSAGPKPDCQTSRKFRWSDCVPNVDVVFSSRVPSDQGNAIVTSLGQFDRVAGGGFTFNTRTGDASGSAVNGQILVRIENDVAAACGYQGQNISGCALSFVVPRAFDDTGSGNIYLSADSLAGSHDVMHRMVDACHPLRPSAVDRSSAASHFLGGGS